MRIIAKCQSCKVRRLFIKKRQYDSKHAGIIVSQSEVCGKCHRGIKKMIKKIGA